MLEKITIDEGSYFAPKSKRESSIREKKYGLVVGIERSGERIINPESTYVLEPGDVVSIAGNNLRIRALQRESG